MTASNTSDLLALMRLLRWSMLLVGSISTTNARSGESPRTKQFNEIVLAIVMGLKSGIGQARTRKLKSTRRIYRQDHHGIYTFKHHCHHHSTLLQNIPRIHTFLIPISMHYHRSHIISAGSV